MGLPVIRSLIVSFAKITIYDSPRSAAVFDLGGVLIDWNPMYVGLVLAYLGEAGLMKQVWPVVFLPLMVAYLNWTVIPLEEAKLDDAFHYEFGQYRLRVRRWF